MNIKDIENIVKCDYENIKKNNTYNSISKTNESNKKKYPNFSLINNDDIINKHDIHKEQDFQRFKYQSYIDKKSEDEKKKNENEFNPSFELIDHDDFPKKIPESKESMHYKKKDKNLIQIDDNESPGKDNELIDDDHITPKEILNVNDEGKKKEKELIEKEKKLINKENELIEREIDINMKENE